MTTTKLFTFSGHFTTQTTLLGDDTVFEHVVIDISTVSAVQSEHHPIMESLLVFVNHGLQQVVQDDGFLEILQ